MAVDFDPIEVNPNERQEDLQVVLQAAAAWQRHLTSPDHRIGFDPNLDTSDAEAARIGVAISRLREGEASGQVADPGEG